MGPSPSVSRERIIRKRRRRENHISLRKDGKSGFFLIFRFSFVKLEEKGADLRLELRRWTWSDGEAAADEPTTLSMSDAEEHRMPVPKMFEDARLQLKETDLGQGRPVYVISARCQSYDRCIYNYVNATFTKFITFNCLQHLQLFTTVYNCLQLFTTVYNCLTTVKQLFTIFTMASLYLGESILSKYVFS
jgi:hypothetical protein